MWAIVRAQTHTCWVTLRQNPRPLKNGMITLAVMGVFAVLVHVGVGMVHIELMLGGLDVSDPSLNSQTPDFAHVVRVQQWGIGFGMVLIGVTMFLVARMGWRAASLARQTNPVLFETTVAEAEARLVQRHLASTLREGKKSSGRTRL
jgi:hypothetical protein